MDTFEGHNASLSIRRPAPNVLLLTIAGRDAGEHGELPLRELARHLDEAKRAVLFIDARRTQGAALDVSSVWARWLRDHRQQLDAIHMLTGSRFV